MSASLEERLRPYENIIMRAQEVLLFKRPVVLSIIVISVISLFSFVKSSNAGVYAVTALLGAIAYAIAVIYRYLGEKITQYLFPELPPETNPEASNRVRSFSEFCKLLECHKCTKGGSMNPLKKGAIFFGLAFLTRYINVFYFNLIAVLTVLILPGVIMHPSVWATIGHKAPVKAKNE